MARLKLITSDQELKAALSSIAGLKLTSISSFMDDAEINHIIPAIGYNFYNVLLGENLTAQQARVLQLLQKAVINYGLYYYVASGNVKITEGGVQVMKDNNYLPASDKKVLLLRRQSRRDAFVALEAAVNFLEAKVNQPYFPEYLLDIAHRLNRRFYCNTTADFSQGFELMGNAVVFAQLKTVMRTVEENYIDPVLGSTVAAQLRAAVLAGTLSDIQQQLLGRITMAVAPLTIAEAIPYRLVTLDESGLITETTKGNADNVEVSLEGDTGRLQLFMAKAQHNGETEIAKLTAWLNQNQSQFPGYQVQDPEALAKINDKDLGVYFL